MSNTNPSENDFGEDPHSQTFATESNAAPPVAKKNNVMKIVMIVFGVLFVAIVGFFLYAFSNKSSAPRPAKAPTEVSAPQVDAPNPAAIESGSNPSAAEAALAGTDAPVTPEGVAAPPAVDPNDPLGVGPAPVDPNTGLALDPSQAMVDPNAPTATAPTATAPTATAPTATAPGMEGQPGVAQLNPQTAPQNVPVQSSVPVIDPAAAVAGPVPNVEPVVAPPVAPVAETAPVPVVNVATDPAQTGAVAGAIDAARRDFLSGLGRIEESVTRLTGRVDAIDNRMTRLEQDIKTLQTNPGKASASVSSTSVATRPSVAAPVKRPVVRKKKPAVAPVHRPVNRLEILDGSTSVVHPRPITPAQSQNRVEFVDSNAAPAVARCEVRAIQPGRAWIKNGNGSFSSYAEGDVLPNGKKAERIDPEKGIIAGGSAWSC